MTAPEKTSLAPSQHDLLQAVAKQVHAKNINHQPSARAREKMKANQRAFDQRVRPPRRRKYAIKLHKGTTKENIERVLEEVRSTGSEILWALDIVHMFTIIVNFTDAVLDAPRKDGTLPWEEDPAVKHVDPF